MQTESYALTNLTKLERPAADEGLEAVERRRALLRTTGLVGRLKYETDTARQADNLWLARQAYPELTGPTLRLWRRFLPTVRPIAEYRYDEVPVESLEDIKTAQGLGCFTRIEIWTPEGSSFLGFIAGKVDVAREKLAAMSANIDPMAVGVVVGPDGQEHFFRIVRWGEALWSESKIKRYVWSVQWRLRLLFQILPALLFCIALVGYCMLIERFGFWPVIGTTVGAIVVLAILTFLVSIDD